MHVFTCRRRSSWDIHFRISCYNQYSTTCYTHWHTIHLSVYIYQEEDAGWGEPHPVAYPHQRRCRCRCCTNNGFRPPTHNQYCIIRYLVLRKSYMNTTKLSNRAPVAHALLGIPSFHDYALRCLFTCTVCVPDGGVYSRTAFINDHYITCAYAVGVGQHI